jgi:hypothetical protein
MTTTLRWTSPQETHQYEPLYLANGTFGGLLNLTGTDLNLWSSRIVAESGKRQAFEPCFPVTALRTQVYYQSPAFRERGFLVSNAAILCDDPIYTSNPSMPHKAVVYQCDQSLDLQSGLATTSGTLFLGSRASLEAGDSPERAIPFQTEVAFLKGSPLMSLRITAKPTGTKIIFDPVPVLEETLQIRNSGNSILSFGNQLKTDIHLEQEVLHQSAAGSTILIIKQARGSAPHSIRISSPNGKVAELRGKPVIEAVDQLEVIVEILPEWDIRETSREQDFTAHAAVVEENRSRWAAFWRKSQISLPPSEAAWQERYETSLFYVAQSLGDAPTHPVGLSQPMLPYWYGSFHDTDTYFCRPLLEAGHLDQAGLNLKFRHRILPRAGEVARSIGQEGAMYPWQVDPFGNGESVVVPLNQAIIACEAWHQFLFRGDVESLQLSGDIIEAVFTNLQWMIDENGGVLRLTDAVIHTFSETIDTAHPAEAYMALRAVAEAYLDVLENGYTSQNSRLGERAERILQELEIPLADDDAYAIVRDGDPEYLRCPSITLGAYPLRTIVPDSRLKATFDKELSKIMSVFAWMPHQLSAVASRLELKEGPKSAKALLDQSEIFYKTWHAFDEWENRRTVRAKIFVTAAGGFCSAIHHMLLAETAEDTCTLFPGVPDDWKDVSFANLHTPHGWRVSAERRDGRTTSFQVVKTHPHARALKIYVPNPCQTLAVSGSVRPVPATGPARLFQVFS